MANRRSHTGRHNQPTGWPSLSGPLDSLGAVLAPPCSWSPLSAPASHRSRSAPTVHLLPHSFRQLLQNPEPRQAWSSQHAGEAAPFCQSISCRAPRLMAAVGSSTWDGASWPQEESKLFEKTRQGDRWGDAEGRRANEFQNILVCWAPAVLPSASIQGRLESSYLYNDSNLTPGSDSLWPLCVCVCVCTLTCERNAVIIWSSLDDFFLILTDRSVFLSRARSSVAVIILSGLDYPSQAWILWLSVNQLVVTPVKDVRTSEGFAQRRYKPGGKYLLYGFGIFAVAQWSITDVRDTFQSKKRRQFESTDCKLLSTGPSESPFSHLQNGERHLLCWLTAGTWLSTSH